MSLDFPAFILTADMTRAPVVATQPVQMHMRYYVSDSMNDPKYRHTNRDPWVFAEFSFKFLCPSLVAVINSIWHVFKLFKYRLKLRRFPNCKNSGCFARMRSLRPLKFSCTLSFVKCEYVEKLSFSPPNT